MRPSPSPPPSLLLSSSRPRSRTVALSTIHQLPSSTRAIGFSCSKHFAVLEILISRFSLAHSSPPSSDGMSWRDAIASRLISRFATGRSTENGDRDCVKSV